MAAMHFSEGLETEGELQDNHWRLLLDRHILCSSEMLMERCFSREEWEIAALPEGFLRFPMAEERKQKAVAISSAVSTWWLKRNYKIIILREIHKCYMTLQSMLQNINKIAVSFLSCFCTSNSPSASCCMFSLIQSGGKQLMWHDKLIVLEVISALKRVSYDWTPYSGYNAPHSKIG